MGDLRHFYMTVRCGEHYAGATLLSWGRVDRTWCTELGQDSVGSVLDPSPCFYLVLNGRYWAPCTWVVFTAISPLYKLIWPLHVRIRGNWAESVSSLLKNDVNVRSLGDTGTQMAPSHCWDFKLSNEGSFVEIGQEMTKLGWKVWKKSLQSLRAESIAVCMQRWIFRRRSLSWETSFDWSEMKVRALPGVFPHPAVRTWPGFQIKWTQPDFSWFFMRTIPAAEIRGDYLGDQSTFWWPHQMFGRNACWLLSTVQNSCFNVFHSFSFAFVWFFQRKGPRLASWYWPTLFKHKYINVKKDELLSKLTFALSFQVWFDNILTTRGTRKLFKLHKLHAWD